MSDADELRALDLHIADRVMGWRAAQVTFDGWQLVRDVGEWRSVELDVPLAASAAAAWAHCPHYSTSPILALLVFEATVQAIGWGALDAYMEDCRGDEMIYHCEFGGGETRSARGPFAEAICRAALAAVEARDA